jgi:N-acetylneuraminate synthase
MSINFCAEVSSNHHQDINRCYDFIDSAAQIGCNSVKFQLFKIDELFHKKAILKNPHLLERKNWELPVKFIPLLSERAKMNNIQFSCTPFYLDAVDELVDHVDFFKIASYEILWKELFVKCAKSKKPVVFSTGMANLLEIKAALNILLENGCNDITILHCSSVYPTKYYNSNLNFINTMRKEFEKKDSILNMVGQIIQ